MIDLNDFVYKEYSERNISKPWSNDQYSFASNGMILIRVPRQDDIPENPKAPDITFLLKEFEVIGEFTEHTIPHDCKTYIDCLHCGGVAGVEVKCQECKGRGEVFFENEYNEYECDCLSCDGTGKSICKKCNGTGQVENKTNIHLGSGIFAENTLALLARLPKCQLFVTTQVKTHHYFTFDGGDGIICSSGNR